MRNKRGLGAFPSSKVSKQIYKWDAFISLSCNNMADSNRFEFSNNSNASSSFLIFSSRNQPHASIAQCTNKDRERCERCTEKDVLCEYSACTNTQSTDTSPSPSSPPSHSTATVRDFHELPGSQAKCLFNRRETQGPLGTKAPQVVMSSGNETRAQNACKCSRQISASRAARISQVR